MFEVWYSNRLEHLTDALALVLAGGRSLWHTRRFETPTEALEVWSDEQPIGGHDDPFEPTRVVVPNWNLKRHLELELSRRLGIASNLSFDRLRTFLIGCLPDEGTYADARILNQGHLQSALFELLGTPDVIGGEHMQPVRDYLETADTSSFEAISSDVDERRELRRFQLASRLAELFETYSYARPEMLETWADGGTVMDRPWLEVSDRYREVEHWQKHLWQALFGAGGLFSEQLPERTGEQFRTLPQWFDEIPAESLELPDRLHVFGLSYVSTVYDTILHDVAEQCDIHYYCLNPCGEYWADLRTGRRDEEEYLFSSQPVEGGLLEKHEPDDFWTPEGENPALRMWGRPGRDHVRMLERLGDDRIQNVFRDPLEDGDSLLKRVQHDIFARVPENADESPSEPDDDALMPREENTRPIAEADESIQFLACTGIRREMEVVANEIWSIMRESARSDEQLTFNEIAVVVNKHQKEEYIAQLESVFERIHDIPYNVVDLPASGESGVLEAVDLLLSLPFGDFRRSELLRFLVHPNVVERWPEADADEWIEWCDRLNIVRGADHEDQSETYLDREVDVFNWDQGLKRLLAGQFMGDRDSKTRSRTFEIDGFEYVPEEVEPDRWASASRLVTVARSLIEDVRALRETDRPLSEWSRILSEWIETYVAPTDEDDRRTLLQCRRVIGELGERELSDRPLSYRAASEFVRNGLDQLEVRRGQYLADGVVVSSFLPMRPIPFKYVFAAGLGADTFPSSDPNTPLDLRTARWKPGDVGPRDRDRYMFLETLISTRRRFYASWVARDPSTGESREPSSVVRELQHVLELFEVDPEDCTERHPLRRYDRQTYFDELTEDRGDDARDPSDFVTFDREAAREARLDALRGELLARCAEYGEAFPTLETLETRLDDHEWARLRRLLELPELEGEPDPPRLMLRDERATTGVVHLDVSLWQLREFLESPLQGGASAVLGMRDDTREQPMEVEVEPVEIERVQETNLLRDVFRRALIEPLSEADLEGLYHRRVRREMLHGEMPTGVFFEGTRRSHLETLRHWHSNLDVYRIAPTRPLRAVGFGRAAGDRRESHPALELELEQLADRLGLDAPIRVDVHGSTEVLTPEGTFLTMVDSSDPGVRYFVRGYISYLVAAAADIKGTDGRPRLVLDPTDALSDPSDADDYIRTLPPLSPEQARSILATIVTDLFSRVHDYLMPVAQVDSHVDGGGAGSFARLVADEVADSWSSGSYEYGPIDDPRAFEAPDDVERLIRRRFGPLYFGEES
jgi:exodeoxyribonuclease V gamma subunit